MNRINPRDAQKYIENSTYKKQYTVGGVGHTPFEGMKMGDFVRNDRGATEAEYKEFTDNLIKSFTNNKDKNALDNFIKKEGEFVKVCGSVDPTSGKTIPCSCKAETPEACDNKNLKGENA